MAIMDPVLLFSFLCLIAIKLNVVECFSTGPPAAACTTLSPNPTAHAAAPQTTSVPYEVNISALADPNGGYSYEPGVTYMLSASGSNGSNMLFRGVFLQGRLVADDTTPAGTFTVSDPLTSLSVCSPPNIGVVHNSNVDKTSITTMWTAPPAGSGSLRIGFAVVMVRTTYWANQRTPMIAERVPGGNNSIEVALERMFYSAVEGGQFEVCVVGTGGVVDTVGGRVISLMRSYRVGSAQFMDNFSLPMNFTVGNSVCMTFTTVDNNFLNADNTLFLQLIVPSDQPLVSIAAGRGRSEVQVIDDEIVTVSFTRATYTVREDANSVQVCLQLSGASAPITRPIRMQVQTADGTAIAGTDYERVKMITAFQISSVSGDNSCFMVEIADDSQLNGDRTFQVSSLLMDLNVCFGAISSATVLIQDNEVCTAQFINNTPRVTGNLIEVDLPACVMSAMCSVTSRAARPCSGNSTYSETITRNPRSNVVVSATINGQISTISRNLRRDFIQCDLHFINQQFTINSNRSVTFEFEGTGPNSVVQVSQFNCFLDGNASPCTSPYTTAPLTVGGHTMLIRPISISGCRRVNGRTVTFTIV